MTRERQEFEDLKETSLGDIVEFRPPRLVEQSKGTVYHLTGNWVNVLVTSRTDATIPKTVAFHKDKLLNNLGKPSVIEGQKISFTTKLGPFSREEVSGHGTVLGVGTVSVEAEVDKSISPESNTIRVLNHEIDT